MTSIIQVVIPLIGHMGAGKEIRIMCWQGYDEGIALGIHRFNAENFKQFFFIFFFLGGERKGGGGKKTFKKLKTFFFFFLFPFLKRFSFERRG